MSDIDTFRFGFEELGVWQKAVEFAGEVIRLVQGIEAGRKHYKLIEQLEAASTSVALNIAEGKGRYSKKEFAQFLYIARGSLYETVTLLVIFQRNNWITAEQLNGLKQFADQISKMLSSLISSVKRSIN
jgi:four helix bundle protein